MKRVYLDMVADLFHAGHINCIRQARNLFQEPVYLIVGVHSDDDVASYKRRPVISEENRYEMVKYCSLVDEVITSAPLTVTKEFLTKNKIDFVIHGDDMSEELKKQHSVPLKMKIVKYVPYTKGVSSTFIINKIKTGDY